MRNQCDTCLTNLKWTFDGKDNSLSTLQTHQAFSIPAFLASYKRVAHAHGLDVADNVKVSFHNCCTACWTKAGAHWEGGAASYAHDAAKTTADGVYFQNDMPDFFVKDAPDLPKIESTIIHEMMHFLSHNHKGLQDYVGGAVNWDEAVNDYMARETWRGVSRDPYKTGYGHCSDLVPTAIAKLMTKKLGVAKVRSLTQKAAGLPPGFLAAVSNLNPNGQMTAQYANPLGTFLQNWLIRWHHDGKDTQIAAAGNMHMKAFLDDEWGNFIFSGTSGVELQYGTGVSYNHP